MDLYAAVEIEVRPGAREMVATGVAVAIPEGHAGLLLPRSGLASRHGLTLVNSPGLIDAGYRGEVVCAVVNLDPERAVNIVKGDRIAQLLVVPFAVLSSEWVDALPDAIRGDAGFGSSGR